MSKATDLVAVARDAGASGYVNVAGDAMTGSLTIDGTNNDFFFDSTLGAIRLRTNEGVEKATIRLDGNDMYVEVANLTRLRIDSAGRATLPYQPAFDATNSPAVSATSVATFSTVRTNVGSHYNSSNGRFTAPVSGFYAFSATGGDQADFHFDIRVNGGSFRRRGERKGSAPTVGFFWVTATYFGYLSAGDYVEVVVTLGAPNWSTDYGGFCGYLLG